ncbi:MAG: hypothetical protein LBS77_01235 [Desulfovibrio sp.]|jgi:hypothetical protein|nr:hypothetical protein [Desulfovibrio sp.]
MKVKIPISTLSVNRLWQEKLKIMKSRETRENADTHASTRRKLEIPFPQPAKNSDLSQVLFFFIDAIQPQNKKFCIAVKSPPPHQNSCGDADPKSL